MFDFFEEILKDQGGYAEYLQVGTGRHDMVWVSEAGCDGGVKVSSAWDGQGQFVEKMEYIDPARILQICDGGEA